MRTLISLKMIIVLHFIFSFSLSVSAETLFRDDFNSLSFEADANGDKNWVGRWVRWNVNALEGNSDGYFKMWDSASYNNGPSVEWALQEAGWGDGPYLHEARNGILTLRAFPAPPNLQDTIWGYPYVASMVSTEKSFSMNEGHLEIRYRNKNLGKGSHIAAWLLDVNGDWPPEIDIFETLSEDVNGSKYFFAYNAHGAATGPTYTEGSLSGDQNFEFLSEQAFKSWHTFRFEWTPDELIWKRNGKVVRRQGNYLGNRQMYFLVSFEGASNWAGDPDATTIWPQEVEIDYVEMGNGSSPNPVPAAPTGLTVDTGGGGIQGATGAPGDIGGMFYGNYTSGDHTGNGRMFKYQGSRRFVAQKTGTVDAATYENRVLLQDQIDDRCAASGGVWCDCKDNGLGEALCGYTLGSSYHVGNGGSIRIELQTDDGTPQHLPSGHAIAETAGGFVPLEHKGTHFPPHAFLKPAHVEAGKIYHLVLFQENPPDTCRSSHSVSEAKDCPQDKGLISFNGAYHFAGLPNTPFGGGIEANLTRDAADGLWQKDGEELAWYGLRYEDDKWYGNLYAYYRGYYTGNQNGNHIIGGSKKVRQKFTVQDNNYTANGIWIRAARKDSGTLNVDVKGPDGETLAHGTFASSDFPDNCGEKCSGKWGYTDLSDTVRLEQDQTYTAEFSATGQISLQTGFPLDYGAYNVGQSGSWWSDAQAEVSMDNGGNWAGFSGNYYPKRDLSLLFTLEGQPKEYLR